MLSRVAERIYWLGRYLERAEDTARLVGVNAQLLMDLPHSAKIGWHALIDITGSTELFDQRFQRADERNVLKFLLTDTIDSVSVLRSLDAARENARTTREIIPTEAWEQINDLYLDLKEKAGSSIPGYDLFLVLQNIVTACQRLVGIMSDTMRRDDAFRFHRLGRCLERADMTTRILDVGSANLLPEDLQSEDVDSEKAPYEAILWMSVLQSVSAYQSYRQTVTDRVNGEDVLIFLLQDLQLPRAVACCLGEIETHLQHLPHSEDTLDSTALAQMRVREADIPVLLEEGLHEFLDELQIAFAAIHEQIAATWFATGFDRRVSGNAKTG